MANPVPEGDLDSQGRQDVVEIRWYDVSRLPSRCDVLYFPAPQVKTTKKSIYPPLLPTSCSKFLTGYEPVYLGRYPLFLPPLPPPACMSVRLPSLHPPPSSPPSMTFDWLRPPWYR